MYKDFKRAFYEEKIYMTRTKHNGINSLLEKTNEELHAKDVEVVPYDPIWSNIFDIEAKKIKAALGNSFIAIHHIGSTSVPGLAAKPKIDIIGCVNNLNFDHQGLANLNYEYRGGFNIPLRKSFTYRSPDLNVNLHIFEESDPEVELNLTFRDYLRSAPELRNQYAALKYKLLEDDVSHKKMGPMYRGYTLGKHDFIQDILKKSGFNALRFVICTHGAEWKEYHKIRKEQIFDPINIIYDQDHPTIYDNNHYHFILYQGVVIVTIAHIEILNPDNAALRSLATDTPYQKRGFGSKMMLLIEKWLKNDNVKCLKMHSNSRAEKFYRKSGYQDCNFDDPCINEHFVNLGKML